MHPVARLKTHALRRIMERAPGNCPGTVLRSIDEIIDAAPALIACNGEALYRVRLEDGTTLCVVIHTLGRHFITVMNVPCRAHVASRVYIVGPDSIEKVRNENAPQRDNKWRGFKKARQARERFLRNT